MALPALNDAQRERILGLLHADRAKSAARLELLEQRLVCFFRWERATDPAACATAVVRELAARLEAGTEVLDPEGFSLQLAREHKERVPAVRADPPVRLDTRATEPVSVWLGGLSPRQQDLLAHWFPFDPIQRESARSALGAPGNSHARDASQAIDLRERCSGFVRQQGS